MRVSSPWKWTAILLTIGISSFLVTIGQRQQKDELPQGGGLAGQAEGCRITSNYYDQSCGHNVANKCEGTCPEGKTCICTGSSCIKGPFCTSNCASTGNNQCGGYCTTGQTCGSTEGKCGCNTSCSNDNPGGWCPDGEKCFDTMGGMGGGMASFQCNHRCEDGGTWCPEGLDACVDTDGDGKGDTCGADCAELFEQCGGGTCKQTFYQGQNVPAICVTDPTFGCGCIPTDCGNGEMEGGEQCDDGNTSNGDGCSSICMFESYCGDAIVDSGEDCDNGKSCSPNANGTAVQGKKCLSDKECKVCLYPIGRGDTKRCGGDYNGTVCTKNSDCGSSSYSCKYDTAKDPSCNSSCKSGGGGGTSGTPSAVCGNGIREGSEECDNGNDNSNTRSGACRTSCRNAYCGDGVVDPREYCDGDSKTCRSCQFYFDDGVVIGGALCGNGIIDSDEECDDRNTENGDGCTAACLHEEFCGDGISQSLREEECDNKRVCRKDETPNATGISILGAMCLHDNECRLCMPPPGGVGTKYCGGDPNGNTCEDNADCEFSRFSCIYDRDANLSCNSECKSTSVGDLASCGNRICDEDESCSSCLIDCGACVRGCGDKVCNEEETCKTCSVDCGSCFVVCGDGQCEKPGETCSTCSEDCGTCPVSSSSSLSSSSVSTSRSSRSSTPRSQRSAVASSSAAVSSDGPTCGDGFLNQAFEECEVGILCQGNMNCKFSTCSCIRGAAVETRNIKVITDTPSDSPEASPESESPSGPICGDNEINQLSELCDQGPENSDTLPDRCRTDCTFPICGDGVLDSGEECDGEANCGSDCRKALCGNGLIDPKEECDDGNIRDNDGCSSACVNDIVLVAAASICGDGVKEDQEECDDSNATDGDGCTANCLMEAGTCGDGIIQKLLNEQCEPSTHDPSLPYECTAECLFVFPLCGNEILDLGEECDEGIYNSSEPGALCRPNCLFSHCGDGVMDGPELCDDGNFLDNDGCSAECTIEEARCGDDIVQKESGEQCEPLTHDPTLPYTCSDTCEFVFFFCGNGLLDEGEVCDDGNRIDGDGCSQSCFIEEAKESKEAKEVPPPIPHPAPPIPLPQVPTVQPLPFQFPLAQLRPLIQQAPIGDTGPASVAVIAAGAAAGIGWMRRRRSKRRKRS